MAQVPDRQRLSDNAVERRAIEAANWGIPLVNFERMHDALIRVPS